MNKYNYYTDSIFSLPKELKTSTTVPQELYAATATAIATSNNGLFTMRPRHGTMFEMTYRQLNKILH